MSELLSDFSTAVLLKELAGRSDVRDNEGILSLEAFEFMRDNSVLPAVDGLPVRKGRFGWEIGLIRRNTGFYKGKLWVIGGRVLLGESNEMALKRHFRNDLGVEIDALGGWFQAAVIGQYVRDLDVAEKLDIGHNPPYQTVSPLYLVLMSGEVKFGQTAYGGQEASALKWFPASKIPPQEEMAYRGYEFVRQAANFLLRNFKC